VKYPRAWFVTFITNTFFLEFSFFLTCIALHVILLLLSLLLPTLLLMYWCKSHQIS